MRRSADPQRGHAKLVDRRRLLSDDEFRDRDFGDAGQEAEHCCARQWWVRLHRPIAAQLRRRSFINLFPNGPRVTSPAMLRASAPIRATWRALPKSRRRCPRYGPSGAPRSSSSPPILWRARRRAAPGGMSRFTRSRSEPRSPPPAPPTTPHGPGSLGLKLHCQSIAATLILAADRVEGGEQLQTARRQGQTGRKTCKFPIIAAARRRPRHLRLLPATACCIVAPCWDAGSPWQAP